MTTIVLCDYSSKFSIMKSKTKIITSKTEEKVV